MSILETNKIDIVASRPDSSVVRLVIADHLSWLNFDGDWYAFIVRAADVGKVVHVVTSPGDASTDLAAGVLYGDCTTTFAPLHDANGFEDFVSDPIATAGTYVVRILDSGGGGLPGSGYVLKVTLEAPSP